MTPYELGLAIKSYSERKKNEYEQAAFIMWHGAVLARMDGKKFPPLSDFIKPINKPLKQIDERAIIARLKAYNKRLADDNSNSP